MIETENKILGNNLKRSGLKNTKCRAAILEILEHSDQPIAADQVFLALKGKGLSANLSTVYRTLEALAEKNLVTKLTLIGCSRTHFELNRMLHRHYLVCLKCNKILAIDHCPLENYVKTLEAETEYSILGHKLNLYGYCSDCQNRRPHES